MKQHRSERGQTLVLIVFGIVALFGFAALAVDLGRVFSERRRAQNAADAAAFAAAMAKDSGLDWATNALTSTQQNDYYDPNPNENADQPMDVQVYHPPISGPFVGDDEYYQVFIRSQVDPIFAHFIFPGLLEQEVESVARVQPTQAYFSGDALAAVSTEECKAVWFQGNAGTYINGGNVFSNSKVTGGSNGYPESCDAGVQSGSGALTVTNGEINSVGTFDYTNAVTATGGINQNIGTHKTMPNLGIPDCFNDPNFQNRTFTSTGSRPNVIQPGYYKNGIKVTNGDVQLTSGMYCLEDDFAINGGTVRDIPDPVTGKRGVFIVMLKGNFDISGNVVANLNRMNAFRDFSNVDWNGILMYMPNKSPWINQGIVHLGGTGNTRYTGTILATAPAWNNNDKCVIEGNSGSISMASNVICYTVKITGNATVKINYKPEQNLQIMPMLEHSR